MELIIVILDCSGSMRENLEEGKTKLDAMKESVKTFIEEKKNFNPRIACLSFSGISAQISVLSLPTNDYDRIINSLRNIEAFGGTWITRALIKSIEMYDVYHKPNELGRIILFSDGRPNSRKGVIKRIPELIQRGIPVDTMGIGDPDQVDTDLLKRISNETQGRYLHSTNLDEMTENIKTVIIAPETRIYDEVHVCRGCGRHLHGGEKYCPYCGIKL